MTASAYTQLQRDIDRQSWPAIQRTLDTWGYPRGTEILNARFGTSFSVLDVQAIAQRYQSIRAARS